MAIEFELPDLGENVSTGTVVKILVAVNEEIHEDQPVLELETGKAIVEIPSTVTGKIEKIHVKIGDKIKVGDAVFAVAGKASAKREIGRAHV